MKFDISTFDTAEYLDNEEVIAAYLAEAAEDENPDVLITALGDVARARGMSAVAEKTGLGRESLYKALRPGSKPRYETIHKIMRAVGTKLSAGSPSQPIARANQARTQPAPPKRRRVRTS